MNTSVIKKISPFLAVFGLMWLSGCQEGDKRNPTTLIPDKDLGTTIGSLAEVYSPDTVVVEGYGLIGKLRGTGSAQCPTQIRRYLHQYISGEFPNRAVDVDSMIASQNSAVVRLEGVMPASARAGTTFDLQVEALESTQTTSIQGGRLYGADLWMKGAFGVSSDTFAQASGEIYVDQLSGSTRKRSGYILGGGRVTKPFKVAVSMNESDYRLASAVRNRINARYGPGTARALSPKIIQITVPARYSKQKARFVAMLSATYLSEQSYDIVVERAKAYSRALAESENKYAAEIALQAIGTPSLPYLTNLLSNPVESVRFHAARCMLFMGRDAGLDALRKIAMDSNSELRFDALKAIAAGAKRSDAAAIAIRLLRDKDLRMRVLAYEKLIELDDVSITRTSVARDFYVDQVPLTGAAMVYAARSKQQRIAIFGAPIRCEQNIFLQSPDNTVVLNSPEGQGYVSLIRNDPDRQKVVQVRSSHNLAGVIRALGDNVPEDGRVSGGLGLPYSEILPILKKMCDEGVVDARFAVSGLPKIGQ